MVKVPNLSQDVEVAPKTNPQTMSRYPRSRENTPFTSKMVAEPPEAQCQAPANCHLAISSSAPFSSGYDHSQPSSTAFASAQETTTALEQAQSGIEVDVSPPSSPAPSSSATDAGYETDSIGSATTSLASSIRDFAFENGRRYHRFREGAYNFPNDDLEQDREDMKHAMTVMVCGRMHFAPLKGGPMRDNDGLDSTGDDGNGADILDMGTGTGIWCMESR